MSDKVWWYDWNGQQIGPMTYQELVNAIIRDNLDKKTLVWKLGMRDWLPFSSVEMQQNLPKDNAISNDKMGVPNVFNKVKNILYNLLDSFDNGNFFRKTFYMIYVFQAFVFLLLPIYWSYIYFEYLSTGDSRTFLGFLFVLLLLILVSIISFAMWWHRSKKIKVMGSTKDEFSVTPLVAHFFQTIGETYSINIGLGGTFMILLLLIFIPHELRYNLSDFLSFYGIISCLTLGFVILIITRLISETIRALTAIANNTKK